MLARLATRLALGGALAVASFGATTVTALPTADAQIVIVPGGGHRGYYGRGRHHQGYPYGHGHRGGYYGGYGGYYRPYQQPYYRGGGPLIVRPPYYGRRWLRFPRPYIVPPIPYYAPVPYNPYGYGAPGYGW